MSEQGVMATGSGWNSESEMELLGVAVSHSLAAKRWLGTKNIVKSTSKRADVLAVKNCLTVLFVDMVDVRFTMQI